MSTANGTVLTPEAIDAIAERVAELVASQRATTPDLVDSKAAAALLGVPASWIEREARAGRIPNVQLGHYRRFNPDALREWWQARERGPR